MIKQIRFHPRFGIIGISVIAVLIGPIILIVVATLLGYLQSGYQPIEQTISALVLGPLGQFQTIVFFVFGVLTGISPGGFMRRWPVKL